MPDGRLEDQLNNLLAVTDTRLTRLDVDHLLSEVLDRLRSILAADTAVVLLREEGSDDLVARAAVGLELEVRQGVRMPIGTGFAGTIAARKEPLRLERVDATTVANPILWELGIQRLLGVPLLVDDTVIGVLHLGRKRAESFTDQDTQLLQVAAQRFSAAIQTRRLAVEAAAAASLERGLLPTRLPQLPGLQFAARYAPAEDRTIGGDWYDAFVLPSGQLWVVIGDVAGHGLHSAVIMSRVKSALRAYALLGDGPARVLEMTNRKLSHFEIGTMVTIMCAVARPPYDRFEISSAGHPPPVRATPGAEAELLPLRPGPPLGAVFEAGYTAGEFDLPPGAALLLCTDGLVERRDEAMDSGLARLRATMTADDAETICQQVMRSLVGDNPTLDDVAVLAVRRTPEAAESARSVGRAASESVPHEAPVGRLRLPPHPQSVARARAFAVLAAGTLTAQDRSTLELMVSEVATNSVVHARSSFTVEVARSADRVWVVVTDHGGGHVTVREAAPDDIRGRGIYLLSHLAESWGVRAAVAGPGKAVWFTLLLQPSASAESSLPNTASGSASG